MSEWRARSRWTGSGRGGRSGPASQHGARYHWRPKVPPTQQVPDWEKDFCVSECHIPWERLTDTKKVINLYGEVTHWDDSAEEEAFNKAKSRYWAKINGLQCDNPFPDPDEYIDLVDFDAVGDPEIDQDLDHPPTSPVESESDGAPCRLTSNHIFFANEPIVPSGWGDESDDPAPTNYASPIVATGWSEEFDDPIAVNANNLPSFNPSDPTECRNLATQVFDSNIAASHEYSRGDRSWYNAGGSSGAWWQKGNRSSARMSGKNQGGGNYNSFGSRYWSACCPGYYHANKNPHQTNNNPHQQKKKWVYREKTSASLTIGKQC